MSDQRPFVISIEVWAHHDDIHNVTDDITEYLINNHGDSVIPTGRTRVLRTETDPDE